MISSAKAKTAVAVRAKCNVAHLVCTSIHPAGGAARSQVITEALIGKCPALVSTPDNDQQDRRDADGELPTLTQGNPSTKGVAPDARFCSGVVDDRGHAETISDVSHSPSLDHQRSARRSRGARGIGPVAHDVRRT